VAQGRLRRLDDGRVVHTLKTPWADGTRQLLFEPLMLQEKLAALIPRPRINLVSTTACWRRIAAGGHVWWPMARRRKPVLRASDTSKSEPRHWAWAALMRRAFDLERAGRARAVAGGYG
jgi:hypothetical protein